MSLYPPRIWGRDFLYKKGRNLYIYIDEGKAAALGHIRPFFFLVHGHCGHCAHTRGSSVFKNLFKTLWSRPCACTRVSGSGLTHERGDGEGVEKRESDVCVVVLHFFYAIFEGGFPRPNSLPMTSVQHTNSTPFECTSLGLSFLKVSGELVVHMSRCWAL